MSINSRHLWSLSPILCHHLLLGKLDSRRKNGVMSSSIGAERHHLARQVQNFRMQAKKLKKIFKETVTVLSDLQDFDEALSIDQILAVDAHKCISNVVSGRTALVVFGDTRLRVSIVNEILGKGCGRWCCVCVYMHVKFQRYRKLSF